MRSTPLRRSRRGGVLLDAILGFGIVVLGAFALDSFGLNLHEILQGAGRFFGLA